MSGLEISNRIVGQVNLQGVSGHLIWGGPIAMLGLGILITYAAGNDTDNSFWYGVFLFPLGLIEIGFGVYIMKIRRRR